MLAVQALDALCRHLEGPQNTPEVSTQGLPWHPGGAADLAKMTIEIADATLSYARKHPEQVTGTISHALEWPAIVSVNPSRDIRKVARNAGGAATRFYAPVLSHLGKDSLFPNPHVWSEGIFQGIAWGAAHEMPRLTGYTASSRALGLPWWLDYVSPDGVYTPPPSTKRREHLRRTFEVALPVDTQDGARLVETCVQAGTGEHVEYAATGWFTVKDASRGQRRGAGGTGEIDQPSVEPASTTAQVTLDLDVHVAGAKDANESAQDGLRAGRIVLQQRQYDRPFLVTGQANHAVGNLFQFVPTDGRRAFRRAGRSGSATGKGFGSRPWCVPAPAARCRPPASVRSRR